MRSPSLSLSSCCCCVVNSILYINIQEKFKETTSQFLPENTVRKTKTQTQRMGNSSARTTNHVPEMTEKEKMQQMYPGGTYFLFSQFLTFHNSDAFEQTPTWRCRKIIFERSSCLQDSTHRMWWKVLSRRRMFKHMQSRMFTIWDDPPWKSSRTRTETGTFSSPGSLSLPHLKQQNIKQHTDTSSNSL